MSFRLGIVGAGKMARLHAAAFQAIPGVEISAVQSRTPEKAEAFAEDFGIPHKYPGFTELVLSGSCDGLLICVSPEALCAVGLEAMKSGLPLLMEKPPGLHLGEAERLAASLEQRVGGVWVALNRRYFSSTLRLRAAVESVSGPRYVHVVDQQNLADSASRGHSAETLAHWMFANSLHLVDLLRLFCRGEVTAVRPVVPWRDGSFAQLAVFAVEFSSGDRGLFEANWSGPGPWSLAVTCPSQRWELRPLEQALCWGELRKAPVEYPPSEDDLKFKPGLLEQARAFVDAAQGRPSTLPTLAEALGSMRLVQELFTVKA